MVIDAGRTIGHREDPVLDAIRHPVAILREASCRIVATNAAFRALPRQGAAEVPFIEAYLPGLVVDGRAAAVEHVRASGAGLIVNAHEVRQSDGRAAYWDLDFSPVPDWGADAVLLMAIDVTARIEAERAAETWSAEAQARLERAEDAERTLQSILRFMPEGLVVVHGPDGRVTHMSDYCARTMGTSVDTLASASLDDIVSAWRVLNSQGDAPADPTQLPLARALRGEAVDQERGLMVRPDGSRIAMLSNAAPIRDAGGAIVGALATWRDVSDLEAARSRLMESEARLDLAFRAAGMGSWELDLSEGRVIADGPMGDELLANRVEEMDGFVALFDPRDQPRVRRDLASLRAGRLRLRSAYRVTTTTGEVRWLRLSGRRVPGSQTRFIGVAIDITDEKEREQRLADALVEQERFVRQKDILLKEVNHRVKNSLQMISSLLALQASDIADPSVRAAFGDASRRVTTVARVHQRLYQTEDVARVELGDYLRDLASNVSETMQAGNSIIVRVEAPRIELSTDRAIPLALVANELMTNAIKHGFPSGGNGEVLVDVTAEDDGGLVMRVADTGAGLAPGFDPAARRGLGMRLVRALVAKVRGTLEVTSGAPGAIFTVRVPPEQPVQLPEA